MNRVIESMRVIRVCVRVIMRELRYTHARVCMLKIFAPKFCAAVLFHSRAAACAGVRARARTRTLTPGNCSRSARVCAFPPPRNATARPTPTNIARSERLHSAPPRQPVITSYISMRPSCTHTKRVHLYKAARRCECLCENHIV